MTKDDVLRWLEQLEARQAPGYLADKVGFTAWASEAEELLTRVFVPASPLLQRYRAALDAYLQKPMAGRFEGYAVIGGFDACKAVIRTAPPSDMLWDARVADSSELLEQAEIILQLNLSLAAATVLIGGALEQHLLHVCQRYSVQWTGTPSIAAYNNAVRACKARQAAPYLEPDAAQVEAWGKVRNEAAHAPGLFQRSRDEVSLMLAGVRSFIARVK